MRAAACRGIHRALRRFGYQADVAEVPIGIDGNGHQVKGDGFGKNAAVPDRVRVPPRAEALVAELLPLLHFDGWCWRAVCGTVL